MEYLVTMTTQVPDGTPPATVADVKSREGTRSRELARDGHLLRLWRPPLQPGEWRTLGLFAAADRDELENVLASMPLRVWRLDEITALSPHPNDPTTHPAASAAGVEFLVTFTLTIPEGTTSQTVNDTKAREARRASELASQGHLARLWVLPDRQRALGLWKAGDEGKMNSILRSLPLNAWMTEEVVPLSEHPSDPALTGV